VEGAAGYELTIDQLAHKTSMTTRNIRAHQSRGLLPPPQVRGRTGFYGPNHVERIELIQQLQADGFNLELIKRLLANAERSSADVLRFTRLLREPFADEPSEIITAAELAEQWRTTDGSLLAKAEELGLLRSLGDGTYEQPSPRLIRAGAQLAELGVPAQKALELAARLRRRTDEVAEIYVRLFLDAVWKPFDRAGQPEELWPEVQTALERLRPLAADSLLASFQLAMDDATERAFGRELGRRGRAPRKRR
jgi:DNA-binding transcriptional MerR regulator